MIAEFDSAGLVFAAFLTGNAIHILSADRTDPFQHIHHAVNRCATHRQTEAEKMVEDYNNGLTVLNDASLAYVDTGFGMTM